MHTRVFGPEQKQLDSLLQMDGEWKVRVILSDFALRLMRRQAEAVPSLSVAISDSLSSLCSFFQWWCLQEHCKGGVSAHPRPHPDMCIYP